MKYMRWWCLFVMIGIMNANRLPAAEPADFSGTWVLDLKSVKTTSIDPLLEAQGVPWPVRKFMDTLSVVQVITQTEKNIVLQIKTAMGDETLTFSLDGRVEVRNLEKTLGKVEFRSFWEKNGTVLAIIGDFFNPSRRKIEWTNRRHLKDDGKTMIVENKFLLENGKTVTASRLFRKQ